MYKVCILWATRLTMQTAWKENVNDADIMIIVLDIDQRRRKSMNINKNIKKLLYALSLRGQIYKINTFQFYSEKNCKYCTKYQILKREQVEIYNEETDKFELQDRYKQKEECYSKVDVMKYLIDEYRKGSEADGIWKYRRGI